jgi:hypothetical protein
MSELIQNNRIYNQIKELLTVASNRVLQSVNSTMTKTYFEIGKLIVEEEQNGKNKGWLWKTVNPGFIAKIIS